MVDAINVIIVDDEKKAREGIELLLKDEPNVNLLATCKNGVEAIEKINLHHPDLIFLDIQMPEVNGFEVLASMETPTAPAVIFTTAYDQFALKAFEHHAIDYLLKPFTNKRFSQALSHARKLLAEKASAHFHKNVESLLNQYFDEQQENAEDHLIRENQTTAELRDKLIIKSNGKIHFLPLRDIRFLEGYDSYIKIHTTVKTFIVKESLKNVLQKLPSTTFIRIHKSFIVNIDFAETLEPHFNGDFYLTLIDGQQLKGSRTYRKNLVGILG